MTADYSVQFFSECLLISQSPYMPSPDATTASAEAEALTDFALRTHLQVREDFHHF